MVAEENCDARGPGPRLCRTYQPRHRGSQDHRGWRWKAGDARRLMSKCRPGGPIGSCLCSSDNDEYTGDRILC